MSPIRLSEVCHLLVLYLHTSCYPYRTRSQTFRTDMESERIVLRAAYRRQALGLRVPID